MDEDWRAVAHAEQLLDLRRYAEAEQRFRDVVTTQPESIDGLLGLARALHAQDREREAEAAARSAVALDPERGGSYHVLSGILSDLGAHEAALNAAEEGLRLAPHVFTSHYQHARTLLGQPQSRPQDAQAAVRRALEIRPEDADAHNLLGMCLGRLGQVNAEHAAYRTALSIDPHHVMAQHNLAASALSRGRLRTAASLLRPALAGQPQEPVLHHKLDSVLLFLLIRILGSLLALGAVILVLLATGAPSWQRALAGGTYLVVLIALVRPLTTELPHGVLWWGLGLVRRASKHERRFLMAVNALFVVVLFTAFAPRPALLLGLTALRATVALCLLGSTFLAAKIVVRDSWIALRRLGRHG